MSQIIQKKQGGGMIIWDQDDWLDGLMAGVGSSSIIPVLKGNKGARTLTNIDPSRSYGYIQPGPYPVEATNSAALAGAIVAGVMASDYSTCYGIDANGKVHSYNQSTNTLLNSGGTFPHTIAGTTPIGQDCMIYKHNNGGTPTFSLFFSFYQTVNWNVGAYIGLVSFSDTYMSTTPATPLDIATASPADGKDVGQRTAPHPMCVGSDDILYIGSGRYLHAYDGATGANGTFSSRVLSLPQGFQITGLVKQDDVLFIAGNYFTTDAGAVISSGEAMVYIWDYNSLDITKIIPLKDTSVSSIFIWRGEPHVITFGSVESRGQMRLKRLVGNMAIKLTDINQSVMPVFRGVDSQGQLLYLNCGGNIMTIGNSLTDDGYQVNNVTTLAVSGGSGWIKRIPDSIVTYVASASDGSTSYKLSKFLPGNALGYQTGTYRSGFVDPLFSPGKVGKIRSITVYFKGLVTTESTKNHAITFDTDFSQTSTIVALQTGVATPITKRYFETYRPDAAASDGAPLPTFSTISLVMVWQNGSASWIDSAIVSRVVLDYDEEELIANQ